MRRFLQNTGWILACLLLCLTSSTLGAQPADSSWVKANEAYAAAEYEQAFTYYQQIEAGGLESLALYFNMGNSAFKLQRYAQAILYYERAKLLDPKNADVLYNLDIANRYSLDKISPLPVFFATAWLGDLSLVLSPDGWAVTTLLATAIALVLLLLFFFARSRSGRKWAFWLAIVVVLLALAAFLLGNYAKAQRSRHDTGIVFVPVLSVKSSPDKQGKDLFIIHEGTKVYFIDKVGQWERIELADGRQGWIESGTAEKI